MPELLPAGMPERPNRSRFDFDQWADGQAWKFVRGEDYTSSTLTFRHNVNRWAKRHGYEVKTRPLPALDDEGRPLPTRRAEPVGLAVCFTVESRSGGESAADNGRPGAERPGAGGLRGNGELEIADAVVRGRR
jgi:hypothetical protein